MTRTYDPGMHIASTFTSEEQLLTNKEGCREFFNGLILELSLHKVGEVYYAFPNGAFTAVICLTESHISIHTWPEHKLATFDVFLSNFTTNNTHKTQTIYNRTLGYFNAVETNKHEILR
jgi:S-adenosylmethionine decarboxylase